MVRTSCGIALLVLGGIVSNPAQAAVCGDPGRGTLVGNTCTLTGPNVIYEYNTLTNVDALVLFDAPEILGDDIRFLEPSFRAESLNGAGTDIVTGNFIFSSIRSVGGEELLSIELTEFGDYDINGEAEDNVAANLFLTVGSNTNFFEFGNAQTSFGDNDDSGVSGNDPFLEWLINTSFAPAAEFDTYVDDVALTIQNTLTAFTNDSDDTAWIQKKITVSTTIIPVPAAAWLFASALGLLSFVRGRKISSS